MKKYHYVYRITNKQINKHYYGSRSCNCLAKEDIGFNYFSWSRDLDFILDQQKNTNTKLLGFLKKIENKQHYLRLNYMKDFKQTLTQIFIISQNNLLVIFQEKDWLV